MNNENILLEGNSFKSKIYSSQEEKVVKKSVILQGIRPYAMIMPSMILFLVFMIYPIFYMVYLSFFKWNLLSEMKFIGLANYLTLFHNEEFWEVLFNTLKFMSSMVIVTIFLSLVLSLYLKKNTRINRIIQSVMFSPYIVSLVSVAFVWMWMMDTDFGLLNYVLKVLHLPEVGWLEDPKVAMYSLVLVNIWKALGYNTIIFISALQSIPPYLYEAANLDKATKRGTFFKITLPMLSPTLFFLTLMDIIAALKVFETIHIMTTGGPMNSTNSLAYYIYQNGFSFYKIGYASAVGVVLMVMIGIITILYFKLLSKKVHYR